MSHIETISSTLEKQLHALKRHRNVGDVRGRGLMFGVELVTDKDSKTPLEIEKVERIVRNCKENGLMIRNLENVITFVPVLSMSNKEVKRWYVFLKRQYITF